MTCSDALALMLEADLVELRATAASPLADHLRGCMRCQLVASHLTRDTRLLAMAVARRRPRRAPVATRYGAAAIAASLCLALAHTWRNTAVVREPTTLPGAVVVATSTLEALDGAELPPNPATVRARPGRPPGPARAATMMAAGAGYVASPVRPHQLPVVAADRPLPVSAVRLDEAPHAPLGTTVSVDPLDGKRATIMRTGNPALTVVWLQN
jgi:hypothetical protein